MNPANFDCEIAQYKPMKDHRRNWPQKKDKLFLENPISLHSAAIRGFTDDKWGTYDEGYRQACDVLLDHVLKKGGKAQRNFIVYPILYLYRHYIELLLKEIIKDGYKLFNIEDNLPCHHRLCDLWTKCWKIIDMTWPPKALQSKNDLNQVKRLIIEFSKQDLMSDAFRYPMDKKDKPTLEKLQNVDLENFKNVVGRLCFALESLSNGISASLSISQDHQNGFFPREDVPNE